MSRRKRKSDVAGAVAGAEDTLGKKVPRGTEGTGRQQPPQGPRFRVNPAHDSNAVCGVTLSHDRMEVVGRKGYRMTLGTHGAAAGCWFFEFKVLGLLGSTTDDTDAPPPAVGPAVAPAVAPPGRSEAAAQRTAHTRLGWATAEGNVDAPAGYDRHSFSYGSKSGGRIHQSRRRAYAEAYGGYLCRSRSVCGCVRVGGKICEKRRTSHTHTHNLPPPAPPPTSRSLSSRFGLVVRPSMAPLAAAATVARPRRCDWLRHHGLPAAAWGSQRSCWPARQGPRCQQRRQRRRQE